MERHMKKILVTAAALFALSACACMNSKEPKVEERKVVYRSYQASANMDCDYIDNNTCYRYVRAQAYAAPAPTYAIAAPALQYVAPAPRYYEAPRERIRYRRQRPAVSYVDNYAESEPEVIVDNGSGNCAPKYRSTREPVEVVYKKTTYKTVYEPKTTSSVSYEKEPYTGQVTVRSTRPSSSRRVSTVETVAAPVEFEEQATEMTLDEIK